MTDEQAATNGQFPQGEGLRIGGEVGSDVCAAGLFAGAELAVGPPMVPIVHILLN